METLNLKQRRQEASAAFEKTGIERQFVRDVFLADRYEISRSTVWRWVREGLLPKPTKIAGSSRFDLAACDRVFHTEAVNAA